MIKLFNNWSIRFKLLFYFLTLTLLSILTIGILTNLFFSNAMGKSANESAIHAISQVNISIDDKIRNIENIIDIIAKNPEVIRFLKISNDESFNQSNIDKSGIKSFLSNFKQYYSEIEGISILNKNDVLLSNEMVRLENYSLINDEWFKAGIQNPESIQLITRPVGRNLVQANRESGYEILSIVKAVKDPVNGDISGVILIDLRIKMLEYLLKNVQLGKVGFVYVVDSKGEVVYSPENFITPRIKSQWFSEDHFGNFSKYIRGQHFQFIYTSSFYTKWKIIGVFSLIDTVNQVSNFRFYTLIILLIISVIAIGFSVLLSASIAKPIKTLRELMKRAESGDLDVNFSVKYKDEIGHLGNSFNTMLIEIRKLIDVVYKEQQSKRKAELMILQAQIKPHFLYNTLDTIHWMVKKYGANDVIDVINALTSLFRIGLSKGNELIKVSDEIEHVRSYLFIQKVRYRQLLNYEIDVEAKANLVFVQKIILQPIVENAIYHGIKPNKKPGNIEIKAQIANGILRLTVTDDGCGMSENQLHTINEALNNDDAEKVGYGLFNVHERIRISYGKEYGVTLTSVAGAGTVVEIRLPIITHERRKELDV